MKYSEQFNKLIIAREQYNTDLIAFTDELRETIKSTYQMKLLAEKMEMSKKTLDNKFRKPSTFKDDEINRIIEILESIEEL